MKERFIDKTVKSKFIRSGLVVAAIGGGTLTVQEAFAVNETPQTSRNVIQSLDKMPSEVQFQAMVKVQEPKVGEKESDFFGVEQLSDREKLALTFLAAAIFFGSNTFVSRQLDGSTKLERAGWVASEAAIWGLVVLTMQQAWG